MTRVLLSIATLFAFYLLGGGRTFSFSYEVMYYDRELMSYLFAQFPETFRDWDVKGFHTVLFCSEFILVCYIMYTCVYKLSGGGKKKEKARMVLPTPPRPHSVPDLRASIPEGHGSRVGTGSAH